MFESVCPGCESQIYLSLACVCWRGTGGGGRDRDRNSEGHTETCISLLCNTGLPIVFSSLCIVERRLKKCKSHIVEYLAHHNQ